MLITPLYDRSRGIVNSVNDVQETLLIAFVLVVLVIFLFLGRATDTLIPAVALPISLLLTFIAMELLGYSLDNLSLMALTLAIGFLVDDAIVFLENTVRRMERGEAALEATLQSAKEISFTILSMTISLAAVFIPLVFMSGLVGRIFREFAITIVVSIIASGLVSLTLTPLMCARLLKARGEGSKRTWMERKVGGMEKRVLDRYGRGLSWFIVHRWISALIWLVCIVGTVYFFIVVPKAFLPPGDSGVVTGVFIAREGSSPEQMRAIQDQVDAALLRNPNILATIEVAGLSQFIASNQGIIFTFLKPAGARGPIQQEVANLMGSLGSIPGVIAFLRPFPVLEISTGATNQNQGQYAFSISGVNPNQVYDAGAKLMAKLREFPGFLTVSSDYYNNTPNLDIELRREQAKSYGVSETRILSLLRSAYAQNYVYLIKKPADQYQVILEVADSARSTAENLALLYIRSDDGKRLVPMDALVSWKSSLGPQAVNHLNQFTSMTISFNLKPGVAIGDATDFITKASAEIVPPTLRASLQGEALTFRDTVRDLTLLMALAVFVMYVILAILYESYLHPLTVLSTLPTALVGGLATLLVFRRASVALCFYRHVHAYGHRQKERHHDRRFRAATRRARRSPGEGDPRRQHGPLPADSHDHVGGRVRRDSDRARLRRRWRVAPAPRSGYRRRFDRVAIHHAVHYAGHLSLYGGVSGTGLGPNVFFPPRPHGRVAGSLRVHLAYGEFLNRPKLGSNAFPCHRELHSWARLSAAERRGCTCLARSLEYRHRYPFGRFVALVDRI